ncbi:PREDICTED: uncharacterized protein LOC109228095 isoform X2 [Nicotiana attenuata]|uniref:uncharacterized protein LOC109228095 isoform X2 n=1 Tax=Nicotiana attenuata TaxID=49451 RepID=UPI000904BCE6|nr:PREDICTED: uncharacterized protein LOC109228095 isoform X2 [Nicotiana attenuata]
MVMVIQYNIGRSAIQIASAFRHCHISYHLACCVGVMRAFSTATENSNSSAHNNKVSNKPPICTADELHYVSPNASDWRLALWRYLPPPQAPRRNHPLLLLSGVGTNAIGYDLSPESSFARYMCNQGFDTWILEVRGTGLSVQESDSKNIEKSAHTASNEKEAATDNANDRGHSASQQCTDVRGTSEKHDAALVKEEPTVVSTVWDESRVVTKLTEAFMRLSERVSGFVSGSQSKIVSARLVHQISKLLEGSFLYKRVNAIRKKLLSLLETREKSAVLTSQVGELSKKLVNIFEEGQRSVSSPLFDLQERLTTRIGDFQEQLDLILKYDWDFDHYLEEDVPAAMEYIKVQTKPKDDKLLAIGHSMGGILLYARLSWCVARRTCWEFEIGLEGREPGLAAVVTLASSLDYTSSKSALKLLLPLADPAQVLNVPVIPLRTLLAAAYPLSSRAPYVLAWLNEMISATNMMHPDSLKKLVQNSFCNIPAKLLLQLATAFQERGLRDRSGNIFYKDHLHKSSVPVLALAGDLDQICPPEAVYETVKLIPENLVTYKVFGDADGPHYAHYDLVGGYMATEQLYPCVVQFLSRYDGTS